MTRCRGGARVAWILAALLLAAAVPASAQQDDLPAVFTETIDVRVVNIEVVVTDREGNRVHGLEASDFEVLVDGEPMPISYFTEIDESVARARAGAMVAGVPNLDPNTPVGTNFLVFVDDLFSINQPGRKVMLLLAGGWPRSPALFTVAAANESTTNAAVSGDGFLMSEDELYGPLVSAANLIGYALYPVDLQGAGADFAGDASLGLGPDVGPDSLGVAAGSLNREDMLHGTLQLLAHATGGVPMINAQRDAALAGAVEAAGQPLDVRFSDPVRGRRGRMLVPVEVAIPLDEIELLPVAGQWRSELEVRVTARDMNGNRADMSIEKIRIVGPTKPQPGQFFYYQTELRLRRREHTYVIAVYDPLTGAVLTSTGGVSPE